MLEHGTIADLQENVRAPLSSAILREIGCMHFRQPTFHPCLNLGTLQEAQYYQPPTHPQKNIQLYVLSSLTIIVPFEKKESNIFGGGVFFWRGIITYLTYLTPHPPLRLALRWLLCINYSTIQLGDSCRQRVLFSAVSQTIYPYITNQPPPMKKKKRKIFNAPECS